MAAEYSVKNEIQNNFVFTPFQMEKEIIVFSNENEKIEDIQLIIFGELSQHQNFHRLIPEKKFFATFPNNVRVYINGDDLSDLLIAELKSLLNSIPYQDLLHDYTTGVNYILQKIEFYHLNSIIKGKFNKDTVLSEFESFKSKNVINGFERLGSYGDGDMGVFNLFNYLYRFVKLPPLSLKQIIKQLPSSDQYVDGDDNFLGQISIRICCGAKFEALDSRSFDRDDVGGGVFYSLNIHYRNPLYNLLKELSDKSDQMISNNDTLAATYLGPIVDNVREIKDNSNNKLDQIADLTTNILSKIK